MYFVPIVSKMIRPSPSYFRRKRIFSSYPRDCKSSNNYNMKSVNNKNHQALDILL